MMKMTGTMSFYLTRHYAANLGFMLLLLLGLVYLFDTVELLRRASGKEIPISTILQMGLLKLPEVGQQLLMFAVLFSAIFTFWQLGRRQELVILRSSGFSVWQFLLPFVFVATSFAILNVTIINPFGAAMLSKFETIENTLLANRASYVTLTKEGIWLRQDVEVEQQTSQNLENVILHAEKINLEQKQLSDVMVLFFDQDDKFTRRIDAPLAKLADNAWQFSDARLIREGRTRPETISMIALPTDLTGDDLEESFADPKTISFWRMPSFINTMQSAGFNATPIKVYFQIMLAQPFLFAAMILVAASVSLRPPRAKGTMLMIGIGVSMGFVIFFAGSVLQALGASEQIPVFLAAWTPATVTLLLCSALMLNMEDG